MRPSELPLNGARLFENKNNGNNKNEAVGCEHQPENEQEYEVRVPHGYHVPLAVQTIRSEPMSLRRNSRVLARMPEHSRPWWYWLDNDITEWDRGPGQQRSDSADETDRVLERGSNRVHAPVGNRDQEACEEGSADEIDSGSPIERHQRHTMGEGDVQRQDYNGYVPGDTVL